MKVAYDLPYPAWQLLKAREVAEILSCSPRNVYRLPIPTKRVGECVRWKASDVHDYIERENAA